MFKIIVFLISLILLFSLISIIIISNKEHKSQNNNQKDKNIINFLKLKENPLKSKSEDKKNIFNNSEINLGNWDKAYINQFIKESKALSSTEKQIEFLSGKFLGIKYDANTLKGAVNIPEKFVVNLAKVDCFTYIDYVEALRLSNSYEDFLHKLINVRYQNDNITYKKRNHFFTDWIKYNKVEDVTKKIGGVKTVTIPKILNKKKDGEKFLLEIHTRDIIINYIPSDNFDKNIMSKLKTGDYVGSYAGKKDLYWLDVTHTGIIIQKKTGTYFRNATSRNQMNNGAAGNQVLDIKLQEFLDRVDGLIVLRPQ